MKQRIFALGAVVVLFAAALTACGQREFVKDDTAPTAAESTTAETTTAPAEEDGFLFAANIRMGMSIAEVQAAVGQVTDVTTADDGRQQFSNEFSGVFINYSTTKSVIFMFSTDGARLEQIQFRGATGTDGANTVDAIALFDVRYGAHVEYEGNYPNCIWHIDDVYVVLSEIDENDYAITYTQEDYFEEAYPDEAETYRRAAADA